jgi:hypothetical protein
MFYVKLEEHQENLRKTPNIFLNIITSVERHIEKETRKKKSSITTSIDIDFFFVARGLCPPSILFHPLIYFYIVNGNTVD